MICASFFLITNYYIIPVFQVNFLKEFCAFSQTLQPQNRDAFFKTLSNMGILPALEVILVSQFDFICDNNFVSLQRGFIKKVSMPDFSHMVFLSVCFICLVLV